jgi:hypothetical protein
VFKVGIFNFINQYIKVFIAATFKIWLLPNTYSKTLSKLPEAQRLLSEKYILEFEENFLDF